MIYIDVHSVKKLWQKMNITFVIYALNVVMTLIDLKAMSKLVWQLYNDNMISMEVANMLLDQHYNRINKL
tara:strand:- start:2777 stop:2986 length:210 start_codon:yes stop_codon:yes gene_type:complete